MPPMEYFVVLAFHLMKMKHEMWHGESGFTEVRVLFPVSASQAGVTECAPCTAAAQPCNRESDETQVYLKPLDHTASQP